MAPLEGAGKDLDEKYADNIVKFVSEVRNGKLQGSINIASATVTLLEQIISDSQNATAYDLLNVVREVGRRLLRALPHELVCGNMVRRVLRAIRDEHRAHASQSGENTTSGAGGESLQRLIRLELESSTSAICGTAREQIHSDELVLTCGASTLVEKFLLAACQSRRYRLLVCETADSTHQTHAMAARLSAAGVAVTVISNASVYAVMSRVNKVVMPSCAGLAGGAALAAAGSAAIALAAKHHSVPVIVLAPLHELSPLHASGPQHFNSLLAPGPKYDAYSASVHEFSPRFDLVPSDHVTLFITNL
ncbi:initiation factor 2 subunit family domain-containing protein [Phthorimaea operculella]|nr:initiation factor 2 subunit family domain-containing protein [Phthorimaea operculella]